MMVAFLGTGEIIVILIVALLVFGPQKLPEIGRQIGTMMREMRKVTDDLQRTLSFDDYSAPSYRYDDRYNDRYAAPPAPLPEAMEEVVPAPAVTMSDPPGPPNRREDGVL